jgi:hypothetical protein
LASFCKGGTRRQHGTLHPGGRCGLAGLNGGPATPDAGAKPFSAPGPGEVQRSDSRLAQGRAEAGLHHHRLAHHLLAWSEFLQRDRGRLDDCAQRLNESPLGSGAVNERWVNASRRSLRSISWFWTACQRSLR